MPDSWGPGMDGGWERIPWSFAQSHFWKKWIISIDKTYLVFSDHRSCFVLNIKFLGEPNWQKILKEALWQFFINWTCLILNRESYKCDKMATLKAFLCSQLVHAAKQRGGRFWLNPRRKIRNLQYVLLYRQKPQIPSFMCINYYAAVHQIFLIYMHVCERFMSFFMTLEVV